ncbi:hypothetical protein HK097_008758 [Rhizophlyctis rosea]|uniref:Transmembrane 9 superfamily member n=1 Tax=Rhizophlyctis rosea TaxID=64517 RepID=A0AAD5SBG1_9FUNG|nr:hypothetical protein HK097_008758 [Rhizophlyctis rosea]
MLPYDYYHEHLKMCQPKNGIKSQSESLGSVLMGDRLYNSPVVDNLPAAQLNKEEEGESLQLGISLGGEENGQIYVNNHWEITIGVHAHSEDYSEWRVVEVTVEPFSLSEKKTGEDCVQTALNGNKLWLDGETTTIPWSYSVKWKPSDTPWATRWDMYLKMSDTDIHWFSIVNSVVIVLFLTGMVAMILLRALHKDIARYNALEAQEDAQEDFGWKLVHGDVFRPPVHRMFFAVAVGNGAQLLLMASVTMMFAVLGFLSPSSRGSLSTVMLVFYVCFGSVAGYTSARLYKMFNGEKWRRNVILTAFLLPG